MSLKIYASILVSALTLVACGGGGGGSTSSGSGGGGILREGAGDQAKRQNG